MAARYFCDICTKEVQDPTAQREFRTTVTLRKPPKDHTSDRQVGLKILRSIDGAWNAGHICNNCLGKALEQVLENLRGED